MKPNLRILSLGAGVQSSTLALKIKQGEIPMVDAGIFADTKGEPKAVYDWLDWLKKQLNFPIYTVVFRDLKQDILDAAVGKHKAFTAPFYTKNPKTGKKGMLQRQCTADYKIKPIVKKVREMLGLKWGEKRKKGTSVEMIMGISIDEVFRIKTNRIKYITNLYPLVDSKLSRQDCKQWMKDQGYPIPPRSACTFCPYHSTEEWLNIKKNPKEWAEVVAMDKAIRNTERFKVGGKSASVKDDLYLHRSCVPIDQVNFKKEEPQLDLFNNECEGMCGN
jgi:hypothetical protein